MAQLKDSVVQGSLRATDSLLATTGQFKILNAPDGSNSTTYSAGSSGQVLRSNGSSAYWGALSTSDLGSGTLPVSRGGTGITTSTTKNAVIIGNSSTVTNAFQAIQTKNGAFYATATDGAPSFGTLPIAQGGTGKTNKNDAIAALGGVKKAGDTMTGALTVKGLKGTSNVDYGTTLPNSPTEGQLFFQISDPWYELPAGGTSGQVLKKKTNTNYDVEWGDAGVDMTAIQAAIDTSIEEAILDIYPVGSIYLSLSSANPGTYLGGTWDSFGAGKVLIGVGSFTDSNNTAKTFAVNDSGGEYNHKLTTSELAQHSHGCHVAIGWASGNGAGWGRVDSNDGYHAWSAWGDNAGGNGYHNNMQPYIAVYMWQRTA